MQYIKIFSITRFKKSDKNLIFTFILRSNFNQIEGLDNLPLKLCNWLGVTTQNELWHETSNNMVCATSKASDQPAHMPDWSEPLLVAWIFYECEATDQKSFGVSKLKRRLHRLVSVYTCQNATLLAITCHCSNMCTAGAVPKHGLDYHLYADNPQFYLLNPRIRLH